MQIINDIIEVRILLQRDFNLLNSFKVLLMIDEYCFQMGSYDRVYVYYHQEERQMLS